MTGLVRTHLICKNPRTRPGNSSRLEIDSPPRRTGTRTGLLRFAGCNHWSVDGRSAQTLHDASQYACHVGGRLPPRLAYHTGHMEVPLPHHPAVCTVACPGRTSLLASAHLTPQLFLASRRRGWRVMSAIGNLDYLEAGAFASFEAQLLTAPAGKVLPSPYLSYCGVPHRLALAFMGLSVVCFSSLHGCDSILSANGRTRSRYIVIAWEATTGPFLTILPLCVCSDLPRSFRSTDTK